MHEIISKTEVSFPAYPVGFNIQRLVFDIHLPTAHLLVSKFELCSVNMFHQCERVCSDLEGKKRGSKAENKNKNIYSAFCK